MKKNIFYLNISFLLLTILGMQSLYAEAISQADLKKVQNCNPNTSYGEDGSEDIWFGPGFYYGIWFDNEDDYWGWRNDHLDYPSNRNYYNHDHPIEYHPDDEGRREEDRGGEGERGGRGHR